MSSVYCSLVPVLKKRPKLITVGAVSDVTMCVQACSERDRGATLRLGGGGSPLVPQYWGGGGGGTRHFFLLTLYNFKNIEGWGGGGGMCLPALSIPRSPSEL